MADVELLPLPEHFAHQSERVQEHVRDYARANLAPLQAENERLRAEVERWLSEATEVANGAAIAVQAAEARAERLAEALRVIANQGPHYGPDGTYKTWRHWADIAHDALAQEEDRHG